MNAKSGEKKVIGDEKGIKKLFTSSFFKTGGSLLYCLSALSIIWGLCEIITPIFMRKNLLWEKVLCIGAMNLYEFSLLAVLLVLVLWRGVKDDAVSLVVISALFFVAGGILVDTIANDSSVVSLVIGIVVFIFSGIKIFALRNYVGMKFKSLLLGGMGIILFWNFFISIWMADVLEAETELPVTIWRYGWIIMLSGIGLMVLQSMLDKGKPVLSGKDPNSNEVDADGVFKQPQDPLKEMKEQILHQGEKDESVVVSAVERKPFLNSSGMVWVFTGEILLAAAVHQYVLSYIFDIKMVFGDLIPLCTILSFLLIELFWNYREEGKADVVLAYVPLILIFFGKISGTLVDVSSSGGIIWNPGFITLAAFLWVLFLALRKGKKKFIYAAGAYLITLMLFGFTMARVPLTMASINWHFPVLLALIITFLAGIFYRIPALSLVAVIIGSAGVVNLQRVELYLARYNIAQGGTGMMLIGAGILFVYLLLKDDTHISVPITGAVIFACGSMNLSMTYPAFSRLIILALAAGGVAFFMWLNTRDKVIATIIGIPIIYHIYYGLANMRGWHFVLLSFLLLTVGFVISILKQPHNLDFAEKGFNKGGVK